MRLAAWAATWVAATGLAVETTAFAAHPLQTEDTGTQGAGNVEIENGLLWTQVATTRAFAYQPQFSYGLRPTIDVILQTSWQRQHPSDENAIDGLGDTLLDAKWRFYGKAPWSIGLRAGAEFATADAGLGQPRGSVSTHGVLVTTFDAVPFTVHGNIGLIQNPASPNQRRVITLASIALMWAANERLVLSAETGASSNADPRRSEWPTTSLAGFIWTIVPGLDADLGYQSGLQSPVSREWLAGLTYRFAL